MALVYSSRSMTELELAVPLPVPGPITRDTTTQADDQVALAPAGMTARYCPGALVVAMASG